MKLSNRKRETAALDKEVAFYTVENGTFVEPILNIANEIQDGDRCSVRVQLENEVAERRFDLDLRAKRIALLRSTLGVRVTNRGQRTGCPRH